MMQHRAAISVLLIALSALGAVAQRPASARPVPSGSPDITITEEPGCGPGPYLTPNMQDCAIDKMMGSNGTLTFGFSVNPKSAKKHALLLTLRSVGGAAVMRVLPPGMGMYSGRVVYFNDAVTESILRIPAADLESGDYTVVVQGMGGATQKLLLYLRVQTPPANVTLNAKEKAAMQGIWRSCCPVTKGLEAPDVCSSFLPNALKATKPEDDLCNSMGFVCNMKGQLEKIDFSNAGLKCKKFPAEFGQFPALETLMLRFNNFNEDSFENVADVLSSAPNLRRLMMGNTNITGRIPCRLFEDHAMKTVMFSVNKLEGELPACVLEHLSLEELYMSRLPLTGPLPDTIPADSNLAVWYAINRDPVTGRPAGPGFSGSLPDTLGNARKLSFMEMSGHQLVGGIPALPEGIRMFELQNNKLDGPVESPLPKSLIYFDVSNNSLLGPLPDFSDSTNLTLIDVSQNQLTGELPSSFGVAGDKVVYMDLSRNRIGGDIGAGAAWDRLPSLQYLFLQGNELEGKVPASLAANKKLVALNLAFNRLEGNLDAFAGAVEPARKSSPQQKDTSSSPSGRKLKAFAAAASRRTVAGADAAAVSLALGKKLLNTREDWSILQPGQATQQYFTIDTQAMQAIATGNAGAAGRRLMQAVTSMPAAGGATTSSVTRPAVPTGPAATTPTTSTTPDDAEPVGANEEPTPEPTTTPSPTTTPTTPVEPTPSATPTTRPSSTGPGSMGPGAGTSPSSNPRSSSAMPVVSAAGPPRGRPMPDMAFIAPPTRSSLAGNSMLYFNASNNFIEGGVPEGLGNLEMFRSPANSTDPFDMFVFSRGGPDRTLDLTHNKLYGEFPRFLVAQAADLSDSCLCTTNFTVSAGNQLYCPTKSSLEGIDVTPNLLETFKEAKYTCLMPNQKEPVALDKYLSAPDKYLTSVPSQSELAAPEERPRSIDGIDRGYGSTTRSSSSRSSKGKSGGLNGGEIAGLVIGLVAGLGILGALGYFVGYKKFYQTHKATAYKRDEIPDGPMMDGVGAYPAAAYGGGNTNGSHFNPDAMPVSNAPRA